MNTQRELYCPLTPHELTQRSAELAHLIQKQTETEVEKKSVMSAFTDRINKGIMDIRVMARVVAEERERRQVECKWEYDYERGIKQLVRLDLSEIVEEIPLSEKERQLQAHLEPVPEPHLAVLDDEVLSANDPLILELLESMNLTPDQIVWENREGKCYVDRKEAVHASTRE
jgi:hypothetical protein